MYKMNKTRMVTCLVYWTKITRSTFYAHKKSMRSKNKTRKQKKKETNQKPWQTTKIRNEQRCRSVYTHPNWNVSGGLVQKHRIPMPLLCYLLEILMKSLKYLEKQKCKWQNVQSNLLFKTSPHRFFNKKIASTNLLDFNPSFHFAALSIIWVQHGQGRLLPTTHLG